MSQLSRATLTSLFFVLLTTPAAQAAEPSLRSLAAPGSSSVAQEAGKETTQDPKKAAVVETKKPPVVRLVRPSGAYADLAESAMDVTGMLLGGAAGKVKPFYDLVDQIERLADAKDGEAPGPVLVDLSAPFGLNLPQIAELERSLGKLRAAGVKCYAYLENTNRVQYQLASQCDHIVLADMGALDLGSLAMSTMFLKDAMDKLGVQMDVIRCGDFKGAVEPFVLSRMSTHLREHYVEMLRHMNDDVVRRIARGRGIEASRVRELQRQRLVTAKEALAAGLVDRLVPWRGAERAMEQVLGEEDIEVKNALKKKKRRSFNIMSMMQELLSQKKETKVEDESLVVLHLSGPISDGTEALPGNIVSGPAVRTIRRVADNDKVRGVVVRINSPGGSATASEAIVLALADLAAKKPVVCSMGNMAASGGYYVTCIGRPILAEAGTLTGSIGVFGLKPNIGLLMRKLGIHQELVALDDSASLDAMDRAWTSEQKTRMQGFVDDVYDRFLNHVCTSRKLPRAAVEAIAGGRVWSGEQAVAHKLVDRIGGLQDALDMVAKEASVEPGYEVIHLPRPASFMDAFAKQLMEARVELFGAIPDAVLKRMGNLAPAIAVLRDALTAERPARVWAMMPVELSIR